jgi:hypothetical protein
MRKYRILGQRPGYSLQSLGSFLTKGFPLLSLLHRKELQVNFRDLRASGVLSIHSNFITGKSRELRFCKDIPLGNFVSMNTL